MKLRQRPNILIAGAATIGLFAVTGCTPIQPFPDDYGEQVMKRHYENGEMNDYQYQSGSRVFNPQFSETDPASAPPVPPPTN